LHYVVSVNKKIVAFVGGVGEGRGPDHPESSHESGDAQLKNKRNTRQSSNVAAKNTPAEGVRPWMLHVSDQHQRHENSTRMSRRLR
jgi:hypothetical protein